MLPQPILRNCDQFCKLLEQGGVQNLFPVGLVERLNVRTLCGLACLDQPLAAPLRMAEVSGLIEGYSMFVVYLLFLRV